MRTPLGCFPRATRRQDLVERLKKLYNNIFSPRAISVLGFWAYVLYLRTFVSCVPKIVRSGDLRPLDEAMGFRTKLFKYRGRQVLFDCKFCDEEVRDNTFAFGLVRELFIRDCYFKFHPAHLFEQVKTVVDLGANRGAFSVLMARSAKFVLSVEAQGHFVPVIKHNMDINSFSNYAIDRCFVGGQGVLSGSEFPTKTMEQLLECHGINRVDLLKVDIEGSEFDLFRDAAWLNRVSAVSMEVHPSFGNVGVLIGELSRRAFRVVAADENMAFVPDGKGVAFIYAWKDSIAPSK